MATIRISTEQPGLSSSPTAPHDWKESVYGNVKEIIPNDAPALLGKYVVTVRCHDETLCHNVMTRRSVTVAVHMLNKTLHVVIERINV